MEKEIVEFGVKTGKVKTDKMGCAGEGPETSENDQKTLRSTFNVGLLSLKSKFFNRKEKRSPAVGAVSGSVELAISRKKIVTEQNAAVSCSGNDGKTCEQTNFLIGTSPELRQMVEKLVYEVGCNDETASWVCKNFCNYNSIGELLESPQLDILNRKQMKLLTTVLGTLDLKSRFWQERKFETTLEEKNNNNNDFANAYGSQKTEAPDAFSRLSLADEEDTRCGNNSGMFSAPEEPTSPDLANFMDCSGNENSEMDFGDHFELGNSDPAKLSEQAEVSVGRVELQQFNELLNDLNSSHRARQWFDQRLNQPNFLNIVAECPFLKQEEIKTVESFWRSLRPAGLEQALQMMTYPLITCVDQSQGDNIVEKFFVREESVEAICNFKDDSKLFYRDVSSGLNINFTNLNDYKLEIVGFLGKLENTKKALKQFLTEESLSNFCKSVEKEGSGLYMIAPKWFEESQPSKCFLYFHSKNDEDYQKTDPKSRAIHLVRYLTELTKNIVLLLDEADFRLLSVKNDSRKTEKRNRATKYKVCEREVQKEQVVIEPAGSLLINFQGQKKNLLHGSGAGLCVTVTNIKSSETRRLPGKVDLTVTEFVKKFTLSEIAEHAFVCPEFMAAYLENAEKERFRNVEDFLRQKKDAIMNEPEKCELYGVLDFALVLKIFQKKFPSEYFIMGKFIESCSDVPLELRNLWENVKDLDFEVKKALSCDEETLLTTKVASDLRKPRFDRFILETILSEKDEFNEFKKFNELFKKCWELKVFSTSSWDWPFGRNPPNFDDKRVHAVYKEKAVEILTWGDNSAWFQRMILKKLKLMWEFSEENVTKGKHFSKFPLFKRTKLENSVKSILEKEKTEMIRNTFAEVRLEIVQERSQILAESTQINNICTQNFNRRGFAGQKFLVNFEKNQIEEEKLLLKVFKLSEKKMNTIGPLEVEIESKKWAFREACEINLPKWEVIQCYPINAALILLILNTGKSSRVAIYSLNTKQEVNKFDFGKNIKLCDFDVDTRIICLYSELDGVAFLQFYQLGADFKSYNEYSRIVLTDRYAIQGIKSLCLQYKSKFVWILDQDGSRILKLNGKNGSNVLSEKLTAVRKILGIIANMQMACNGQCLFLGDENGKTYPLMTETLSLLEPFEHTLKASTMFLLPDVKQCLVAQVDNNEVKINSIVIHGAQQEIKLQEAGNETGQQFCATKVTEEAKHWIHNFYWLYVKFPCENIVSNGEEKLSFKVLATEVERDDTLFFVKEALQEIVNNLRATKKPMVFFTTEAFLLNESDVSRMKFSFAENICKMLGDFVFLVISFTPLQIARCQDNEFLVLKNGQPLPTDSANDVFEMKEQIDLGLFEAIFNNWLGPVKVVSSMGKQTCGKSFLLNHLLGSLFNISGLRCTDGCWMTVAILKDCLYVILDFEGLGSFERTDQDDMLLSLFNSALSTMTLFKTDQRIDRETDQLFSKFNLGSSQLKGTNQIFQGTFMIVIRDVASTDLNDIRKEFIEKINSILHKEKHENFISKLYRGGFQINPFSPFQTEYFYEDIEYLREEIVSAAPLFTGGVNFVNTMKMLLAKFAINDFTPLNRQQIDARIKYLKSHLPYAIRFGQLTGEEPKLPEYSLTLLDNQNRRINTMWSFSFADLAIEETELNDLEFSFTEEHFSGIVNTFNQHAIQNGKNFREWRNGLEKFVALALEHRFKRVQSWLEGNVENWQVQDIPEYDDAICSLMDCFSLEKVAVGRLITLCDEKCGQCFLKCTQLSEHGSSHSCITTHHCPDDCDFCIDAVRPCKLRFGHETQHLCKEFNHTCAQKCSFADKNGCKNDCSLMSNHEGEHFCDAKIHRCNQKCSLNSCNGVCEIDFTTDHEFHKCIKEQCSSECCVDGCRNKCIANDHFHGHQILSEGFKKEQNLDKNEAPFKSNDGSGLYCDDHFCGEEHLCGHECEQEGYCEVTVQKQMEKEEVFEGQRQTFTYKRFFTQMGKKVNCLRRVPPFEKDHECEHWCSLTSKKHYCTEMCPTCENICDKEPGHEDLHHTIHGNMTKCYFICNQEDFDVGTHQYKVGEQAIAEYCNVFCKTLGRGHIHVLECAGEDCANKSTVDGERRRHATCKYGPDEDIPKDEIWHCDYWNSIGFQDPCAGAEIENFEKCPCFCAASEHEKKEGDGEEDNRMFCILDLWHEPVQKLSDTGFSSGTVSIDGHVFPCHHEGKSFHWVLTLDKSSSMSGSPWTSLVQSTISFMNSRKAVTSSDKYSIILYDHSACVLEEFKDLKKFNAGVFSQYSASGGTSFSVALTLSSQVIGRHLDRTITPVLLFMSDGECGNGEREMAELAAKYKVDHKLKVYTVGFGQPYFAKLRELARLGGGQCMECLNGIDLEHTFVDIASAMPAAVSVTSRK